jgi:hypothetical protein
MSLKNSIKAFLYQTGLKKIRDEGFVKFKFEDSSKAAEDIKSKYNYDGDLLSLFTSNKGPVVHKWHHYIPLYDRYFSQFRGRPTRFLEIGVAQGGSLELWRKFFGEEATIFGIDINPDCEKFNGCAGQVRIGSQNDKDFLDSVIKEMGGVDVILDDGSHDMERTRQSLEPLFPLLNKGGIYMIEDLHTSYWKDFGGGYNIKRNFFNYLNRIVHDMHHWYHPYELETGDFSKDCTGIHVHDSIVVFEKNTTYRPVHSYQG